MNSCFQVNHLSNLITFPTFVSKLTFTDFWPCGKAANIGIGISGNEGRQAVLASDYSIPKFRFLVKLLLVHGHWNYNRLVLMIYYFLFKNISFVLLIFYYQDRFQIKIRFLAPPAVLRSLLTCQKRQFAENLDLS